MSVPVEANRTAITIRASDRFGNNATKTVTVTRGEGPLIPEVGGRVPNDPDGDGLYTDLNADGRTTVADAMWYSQYRESDAIQDNPELFDIDSDGTAGTVFDVVTLFEEG